MIIHASKIISSFGTEALYGCYSSWPVTSAGAAMELSESTNRISHIWTNATFIVSWQF